MGQIVSISIKNYDFLSYKNTFGDLLMIYSEDDLYVSKYIEDGEEYTRYCFKTTVERAKRCLDCIGCTVDHAKADFEINKEAMIDFAEYMGDEYCFYPNDSISIETLREEFTFEAWAEAAKRYARLASEDRYDSGIQNYEKIEEESKKTTLSCAEKIVLNAFPFCEDKFFGLSYGEINPWNIFRVLLDGFDPDEEVILDYTYLFSSGWCDEFPKEEEFCVSKTIILTEGKYDATVISKSMKLLYPYMCKFYAFINFDDYKVQGSTNFLTHYLKAFIAAGVENRVIALYDNDSAGQAEILELQKINRPDNFRWLKLPEIDIAKDYPTIGPSGNENMDINGKACSIELFLGTDVLKENPDESDAFIPIQWKGYIEKTGTYQGEILRKALVQKRFDDKIEDAISQGNVEWDKWREMDVLLKTIFGAFV